jgi:hypothetical protein
MSLDYRVNAFGDLWNTGTGCSELYQSLDQLHQASSAWEDELRASRSWGRRAMNFVRGLFGLKPKQPRITELFHEQVGLARKSSRALQSMLGQLGYELDRNRAYQSRLMDEVEGCRKECHGLKQSYAAATTAYTQAHEALGGLKLGDEDYVPVAKAMKAAQSRRDDLERRVTLVNDRLTLTAGLITDAEGMERDLGRALGTGQLLAQRTEGLVRHLETIGPSIERYLLTGGSMAELIRQAELLSHRARDIYAIAGTVSQAYRRIGEEAKRSEPLPFGRTPDSAPEARDPLGECEELLARTPTNGAYARRYAG